MSLQIAQKPFRLTEDYVAPKGALIMPSIVAANMQGFSNPSVFDPDRFSPDRKEDIKYQKNFLTFGHGPHYCVGKDYAVNQIICFLANMSTRSASAPPALLAHHINLNSLQESFGQSS